MLLTSTKLHAPEGARRLVVSVCGYNMKPSRQSILSNDYAKYY
jgi:hypothetical protein